MSFKDNVVVHLFEIVPATKSGLDKVEFLPVSEDYPAKEVGIYSIVFTNGINMTLPNIQVVSGNVSKSVSELDVGDTVRFQRFKTVYSEHEEFLDYNDIAYNATLGSENTFIVPDSEVFEVEDIKFLENAWLVYNDNSELGVFLKVTNKYYLPFKCLELGSCEIGECTL